MTLINKIKTATEIELDTISSIFHLTGGLSVKIFKPKDWKVLYFESSPFIDSYSFEYFVSFFLQIKETQLNILPYPLKIGTEYLRFDELPTYEEFNLFMAQYYFIYTGGISFGSNLNWAIFSEADNDLLYFGFEQSLEQIAIDVFSKNKHSVSEE